MDLLSHKEKIKEIPERRIFYIVVTFSATIKIKISNRGDQRRISTACL